MRMSDLLLAISTDTPSTAEILNVPWLVTQRFTCSKGRVSGHAVPANMHAYAARVIYESMPGPSRKELSELLKTLGTWALQRTVQS